MALQMNHESIANLLSQTVDPARVKETEVALQNLRVLPGFYSILLDLVLNLQVDAGVRWTAVLYLKNGIDRQWRKTALNAIGEDEKTHIRDLLLVHSREPSPQIADQLAVIISKIARFDVPRFWPQLLPTLLQRVQSPDLLEQQRALRILLLVVKALCSKALPESRRVLHQMTPELFRHASAIWHNQTEAFFHLVQSQNQGDSEALKSMVTLLERSLLALKCLRQLYVFGVDKTEVSGEIAAFLTLILQRLGSFMQFYLMIGDGNILSPLVKKVIITFGKVVLDTQEFNAANFLADPACIDVSSFYYGCVSTAHTSGLIRFEKLILQSFHILKGLIKCKVFELITPEKEASEKIKAAKMKRLQFWTESRVAEFTELLVVRYLPLTAEELELWKSDPEDFLTIEEEENVQHSIRACVEQIFPFLFSEFKTVVSPLVLQLAQRCSGQPQDLGSILLKEATYCALGLGAYHLFDYFDFDALLVNQLVQEARLQIPGYEIIRRRIATLVGCWIPVKIAKDIRGVAYKLLIDLMVNPNEVLVQLASIKSLKKCIDDFDFEEESFGPFLEAGVPLLTQTLQNLKEFSSRQIVLSSLTAIVGRMGDKIKPFSGVLVGLLQPLWQYSEDQSVLKVTIIDLATKLTEAIRSDSEILRSFSIPVISFSLREGTLLVEDSMELWRVTLQNARELTNDLLELFALLRPFFDTELKSSMEILNSYVLLGGPVFMRHYEKMIEEVFTEIFRSGELTTVAAATVTKVMDTILRSFPAEGHRLFVGVLATMATVILEDKEHGVLIASYLSVFARVLLNDPSFVLKFLVSGSQDHRAAFIDKWIDKVDTIGQPSQKKLTSFALCSLLKIKDSEVLKFLPSIINVCINVYFQLEQPVGELDGFERDDPYDELTHVTADTEEGNRRLELMRRDEVEKKTLKAYLEESLRICEATNGPATFQALMGQVDPDVLKQLQTIFSASK